MKTLTLPLVALALTAAVVAPAQTTTRYRYSQDLSALATPTPTFSTAQRTMYLAFQLLDGSQAANDTSRVVFSNLRLTGGTFGDPLGNLGGVTVNPDGSISLRDNTPGSNGLSDYTVAFNVPANSVAPRLEFDFAVTTNTLDPVSPDYVAVNFLLNDYSTLETGATGQSDRIGTESFGLTLNANPTPATFTPTARYASERLAVGDGRFATFAAPTVTVNAVPEPAPLAVLGLGAAAMLRRRRRSA